MDDSKEVKSIQFTIEIDLPFLVSPVQNGNNQGLDLPDFPLAQTVQPTFASKKLPYNPFKDDKPFNIDESLLEYEDYLLKKGLLLPSRLLLNDISNELPVIAISKESVSTFGTGPNNTYKLNKDGTSKMHCQIAFSLSSSQFVVEDLGSSFGTFVKVRSHEILKQGQIIALGKGTEVELQIKSFKMGGQENFKQATVGILQRKSNAVVWLDMFEKSEYKIGTSADCKVQVPQTEGTRQIENEHAALELRGENLYVRPVVPRAEIWLRLSAEKQRSETPYPLHDGAQLKITPYYFQVTLQYQSR